MELDLGVFVIYVGIIIMFFVFGKLFYWPIKVAIRLSINSLIGGALLVIINTIGTGFGVFIPLNVLNAFLLRWFTQSDINVALDFRTLLADTAFVVNILDYDAQTVRSIHYGAGPSSDRILSWAGVPYYSVTTTEKSV